MNNGLAVIFDMDGVLVDSYHAHFESWKRMAAEEGKTMTQEEFDATFGRTSREIIAMLWPEIRRSDPEIAAMDARKEALFREVLAKQFPAMPGAVELLRALHDADFALALGSSGPPENVDLVLDRLDARPLFDAVITAADVTRGKPDPQVFLTAAAELRIPPERSAVVEDAPPGIAAAKAGGMASVGIASTGRTPEMLGGADLIVRSLTELSPDVLRDLILRHAEAASEE